MKEIGIGKTIIKLRKEQNLTQEDLADLAGVSTRTIQRIEQDEVRPRGDTLKSIEVVLDYNFHGAPLSNRLDRTLLLIIQLSNIFLFILFPIGVLIWNNRMSDDLEREAKKAINFQLNYLLGLMVILVLLILSPILDAYTTFIIANNIRVGLAIILVIVPISISVLCLMNMVKLNDTTVMRYPKGFRFVNLK